MGQEKERKKGKYSVYFILGMCCPVLLHFNHTVIIFLFPVLCPTANFKKKCTFAAEHGHILYVVVSVTVAAATEVYHLIRIS